MTINGSDLSDITIGGKVEIEGFRFPVENLDSSLTSSKGNVELGDPKSDNFLLLTRNGLLSWKHRGEWICIQGYLLRNLTYNKENKIKAGEKSILPVAHSRKTVFADLISVRTIERFFKPLSALECTRLNIEINLFSL